MISDDRAHDPTLRFHSALDLIEHNAQQTARRLRCGDRQTRGDVTLDDLRSLASEGLLRASRSFDPSLGTPFRRWANRRIRDWLAEGLRQWAHLPRNRVSRRRSGRDTTTHDLGVHCIAMAIAEETALAIWRQAELDPEQLLSERELRERLHESLARLPSCQRALITRHDLGGEPLQEVAKALGISKSWATRLRSRALRRMARDLRLDSR